MKGMVILRQLILFVALLMFLAGCTQAIFPTTALPPDPTLEELISLYRKQREEIPPLKGLMKVTITDNGNKGFWAKWRSYDGVIQVDGYDLLGRTLFNLKVAGEEFSLVSPENNFNGNREALEQYLIAHDSEIRIEWVTLLDWIARGGLPDLSTSMHPTLRKDVGSDGNGYFVLSFAEQDIFLDRKSLRTKTVFFNNSDRFIGMTFNDYRSIGNIFFPFSIHTEVHDIRKGSRQDSIDMEIVFKEVKVITE